MSQPNDPKTPTPAKPVFFDPTSHRFAVLSVLLAAFIILVMVWAFLFSQGLYNSRLPDRPDSGTVVSPLLFDKPAGEMVQDLSQPSQAVSTVAAPEPDWSTPPVEVLAYAPAWSRDAFRSVRENITSIDVLLPEWYGIDQSEAGLVSLSADHEQEFREFVALNQGALKLIPVVRTDVAGSGLPGQSLSAPADRQALATAAAQMAITEGYDGLCFDFTGAPPDMVAPIASFMALLRAELASAGRESCIVAGYTDPLWQHPEAVQLADRLIILGFQAPGPYSAPGPLAPQAQLDQALASLLDKLDPGKVVVALGSFGVDWTSGTASPTEMGFFDVTTNAARRGARLVLDPVSLNTTASFGDETGRLHHIWMLDAISAHNTLRGLSARPPGGIAVWPAGRADPGIWTLLEASGGDTRPAVSLLRNVSAADHVRYEGTGALLDIIIGAHDGLRLLSTDPQSGNITQARYLSLPTAYTIRRRGGRHGNVAVLTFDDGPNSEFTPQILDILAEYDVPAAFFVIGAQVLENPEITQRIVKDGHEIGVHTYTHPNLTDIGELRLRIELHATQDLLAGITGQNTFLFRAPYGLDEDPKTAAEARALRVLFDEGYVVVGTEIDSRDWARPGAAAIQKNLFSGLEAGEGSVMLLHDGGGDRSQTVAALRPLIEEVRRAGYSFVPISSILDASDRVRVAQSEAAQNQLKQYSFEGIRLLKNSLTTIFFITILAGSVRSLLIIIFALRQHRRQHVGTDAHPGVTVAIPAYNEAPVIVGTIKAALASDYPVKEVIVVDDGSTDETAQAVRAAFGSTPRVRLITQSNQGKAEALNHAHRLATTPIIVAIDADTFVAPGAVGMLVGHFEDPKVGAVAGNVKVGNRLNLLTRLQAIEYITSQNLDRRAFSSVNGIMVVPGAIGAWRTAAVDAAGGYSSQTLVEDADITVSIIRAGYRVVYEPGALAFTEAPETVRQLVRQRLRWTFGMLQIAWKHKGAIRERRTVGLVSIPDLLIFGVLFSLFAPLADIVMVVNVVQIVSSLADISYNTVPPISVAIVIGYIAYLLSDMLLTAIAIYLEPGEDWRLLPWVLTQRFFYRQIFWFVVLRSVWRALTGRFTGWRKLTRTATVSSDKAMSMARAEQRVVLSQRAGQTDPQPDPKAHRSAS